MFAPHFPNFDIGDFILREHQDFDVEDFFNYYTQPEVNKYILAQIPQTIEDARQEINYWKNIFYKNEGIYFTIARKSDNKMVGSIGLSNYNSYNSRIEISYDIAKEYWGLKIATKSIAKLTQYCFEELKINRLEAVCSTLNEPSFLLLEKCGFVFEGLLRQHRYHLGRYVDVYYYSKLRNEYFQAQQNIL